MEISKDNIAVNMFTNLNHLKKLVVMYIYPAEFLAPIYLKACKTHSIKCVCVDHAEVSEIMVSPKYNDDVVNLSPSLIQLYQERMRMWVVF
jgi:hypothetical protein